MSVHTDLLQRLKADGTLIDLYRDHRDDESLTGVVADFNDTFVHLGLVADDGRANGVSVVFLGDVTRIRWGGNERRSIAELMAAKGSAPVSPVLDLASTRAVLESVNAAFGYVNVLTEGARGDITFIGALGAIDDTSFVLDEFGTMRTRASSHLWLKLADVSRVDAGAPYEEDIHYLARKRGAP